MASVRDNLELARAVIAEIGSWTTDAYARDRAGVSVNPWSMRAACWCAEGALAKVCGLTACWNGLLKTNDEYYLACIRLDKAARLLYACRSIAGVNDGEYPSAIENEEEWHTATLECFDLAIRLADRELAEEDPEILDDLVIKLNSTVD